MDYVIRIPANKNLELEIEDILFGPLQHPRPDGAPTAALRAAGRGSADVQPDRLPRRVRAQPPSDARRRITIHESRITKTKPGVTQQGPRPQTNPRPRENKGFEHHRSPQDELRNEPHPGGARSEPPGNGGTGEVIAAQQHKNNVDTNDNMRHYARSAPSRAAAVAQTPTSAASTLLSMLGPAVWRGCGRVIGASHVLGRASWGGRAGGHRGPPLQRSRVQPLAR